MCLLLLLLNGSDDDDDGLPGELLERSKRDGVSTFKEREREDRVSAALSVLWPNEVINFDSTGVCVSSFSMPEGNPLRRAHLCARRRLPLLSKNLRFCCTHLMLCGGKEKSIMAWLRRKSEICLRGVSFVSADQQPLDLGPGPR